ncbi:hypothetical protein [Sinomonas terrae]|uniref:Transposase n=1 Tax=Sinomonas terrae TaxID=2908838 RepID=A0ABS9TXA8_9MICC|nr:hypothetical protein [Sinomonas terrae]MCH6469059.1 hypothetical protein [Sinomonas terrae]
MEAVFLRASEAMDSVDASGRTKGRRRADPSGLIRMKADHERVNTMTAAIMV